MEPQQVNGKTFTLQPDGTWLDTTGQMPDVADYQQLARAGMNKKPGATPLPQTTTPNGTPVTVAGQALGAAAGGLAGGAMMLGAGKMRGGGDTGFTNAQEANAEIARQNAARQQAEGQTHSQIAGRSEYAEASKQNAAKEATDRAARVASAEGASGASALFGYTPQSTDVTQIQQRQDVQRQQGEQRKDFAMETEGGANTMQGVAADSKVQNQNDAVRENASAALSLEKGKPEVNTPTVEAGSPAAEAGASGTSGDGTTNTETPPAGDTGAPSAEAPATDVEVETPSADGSEAAKEEGIPPEHANARSVQLAGITDDDWSAIGVDPSKDVWKSKEDIENVINPYLKSKGMVTVGADPGGRIFKGRGEKLELNQQSDIHVKRIKRLVSDRKMKNIMSVVDRRF